MVSTKGEIKTETQKITISGKNLRVESDGSPLSTKIFVDGKPLGGIQKVVLTLDVRVDQLWRVFIEGIVLPTAPISPEATNEVKA